MAELEGVEVAPVPSGKSWDLAGMGTAVDRRSSRGKVLAAMADEDPDIVVITADLKFSNQTVDFERAHPDRFVNVGISEQHMVTMAAGMASVGMKPYVAAFAPFVGLLARRADPHRPRLPRAAGADHRPPRRDRDRLLRDLPPRDRGPRPDALDRRPRPSSAPATRPPPRRRCARPPTSPARSTSGSAAAATSTSTTSAAGRLALRRGGGAARGRRPDDRRQRRSPSPARSRRPRRWPPTGSRRR